MIFLFLLSSQESPVSDRLSIGIAKSIINIFDVNGNCNYNMDSLNHIIRKSAHFVFYLILSIFLLRLFKGSKPQREIFYTLLICIAYAVSDEFHQMFVSGRSAKLGDAIIDATGAFAGIVLYLYFNKINTSKNSSNAV